MVVVPRPVTPPTPCTRTSTTSRCAGCRPWSIGGAPYEPERAAERAREQAREFAAATAVRLREHRQRSGRTGLLTFAIDTELLGHWWWEGPIWLGETLAQLPAHGVRPLTISEAVAEHPPERRPARAASWGEGKDLRTWAGAAVADLLAGARRMELRLLRELGAGLRGPAAARAARELLALQASDWAFLDYRGQAGDYPFERVLDHSEEFFAALDPGGPEAEGALRGLAPTSRSRACSSPSHRAHRVADAGPRLASPEGLSDSLRPCTRSLARGRSTTMTCLPRVDRRCLAY